GFDEEAQLLANRGYACVQVNFRGSTGYGKHFRNLGAKQWAASMHTDLLDAVDQLAAAGAIDASRVAIMGCSYGGYAALVGAALKAKGLPYEYLLLPDEGHGLARPENRETYYAAVERFLAEHLE